MKPYLFALSLLPLAAPALAQQIPTPVAVDFTTLTGTVRDAQGQPLELVVVAFRGITIYVFELDVVPDPGVQGATNASGSNVPVVASTLRLFRSGLVGQGQGKASTVAHELGHVLGLTHAFPMPTGYEDGEIRILLSQKEGPAIVLPGQIAALAQAKATAATPPTPVQQADIQAKQDSVQLTQGQLTEINAQLTMYARNPFKFTNQSTNNIMDYDAVDRRCSYWHWQWALLQADVTAYYGTTTAAQ